MRKLLVAIAVAGIALAANDAFAAKLSRDAAKSVCKGKAANGLGGCSWCGKSADGSFCGQVNCPKGKSGDCSLTYTKEGKQPQ
jgi:uncharacterized low-complexity protein